MITNIGTNKLNRQLKGLHILDIHKHYLNKPFFVKPNHNEKNVKILNDLEEKNYGKLFDIEKEIISFLNTRNEKLYYSNQGYKRIEIYKFLFSRKDYIQKYLSYFYTPQNLSNEDFLYCMYISGAYPEYNIKEINKLKRWALFYDFKDNNIVEKIRKVRIANIIDFFSYRTQWEVGTLNIRDNIIQYNTKWVSKNLVNSSTINYFSYKLNAKYLNEEEIPDFLESFLDRNKEIVNKINQEHILKEFSK